MTSTAEPMTVNERQQRWREKQRKKGLKQIVVWVPDDKIEQVRKYVKKLTKD